MEIIISIDFVHNGRKWLKGEKPFVSLSLAREWIKTGRAVDPNNPPTPGQLEKLQIESGLITKNIKNKKLK